LNEKKLPLVGDVRDESAEDVRLVIEPKSRAVDPELMMESLFRLTELESRISLNLNVLIKGKVPRVVGLAECLREWLDHLRDVLVRRKNFRKEQIERRLEILGGYLIAYLNIDKVIKIIRTEDEPKPVLMKTFKLTDLQAESILNMRLRNLRKLEEMEIRTEDKNLRAELKGIKSLLGSESEQWSAVGEQIKKVRDMFGPKTPLGKRRTTFADAPEHDLAAIEEAFVEREPVTIVVSEKGWVRTMKGHMADLSGLAFKTDDKLDHAFFAESTSKLLLFATNGKFYSLEVAKLPGGRGHGEPIRMFIDMDQDAAIVSLFVNKGERKFLIANSDGQGFIVKEEDCVSNTRKGKQVMNVEMPNEARAIATVAGDLVAVIGSNHKMVVFGIDQVPEMARGRGVRLQKYSSATLSDVTTFDSKVGLTWKDSAGRDQSMTMKELADWRGNRADAGRLAHGLPKSNKFGKAIE
jgi:topoisomerase IV subunit A